MAQKQEYVASREVERAREAVRAHEQARPGEYRSEYDQALKEAMDRILNQKDFQYRLNGDALYRQYRSQAVRDARRAMSDTMGQAAALAGGYGSSYAQSAGQQAYQKQMDGLTDQASRLYDKAREDYDRQGQADRDRYDVLRQRENSSYSQYKQQRSDWEAENTRLWNRYDSLRQQEYSAQRDSIKDQQWLAEFEEARQEFYDQLIRKYGG